MTLPTISIKKTFEIQKKSPKSIVFVDARSEKENIEDHIPGSVLLPILDNEERKQVGTLYKESEQKAYDLGYKYFNKKMTKYLKNLHQIDKSKKIVVYCWRGGLQCFLFHYVHLQKQ
jgi:tRNA 2-selenouridine synthase